jgi:hypothetical protein
MMNFALRPEEEASMIFRVSLAIAMSVAVFGTVRAAELNQPPEGFTALFDGKSLDGWWGLGTTHYDTYAKLSAEDLAKLQEKSREDIRKHWRVENGELVNDGHGFYLTTNKFYGDFELLLEYKTAAKADSGIYLRGIPQVQIWDTTKEGGKWNIGADKGSGGLWNNPEGSKGRDPLVLADKPFGEWNTVRILMVGDIVTVHLNDKLVVDKARLHNYFDKAESSASIRPDSTANARRRDSLAERLHPRNRRRGQAIQAISESQDQRWRHGKLRKPCGLFRAMSNHVETAGAAEKSHFADRAGRCWSVGDFDRRIVRDTP